MSPVGRRRRREGRPAPPTSHQPNTSPVLGFEDLDEIGRGASGRVYRARQQRMNREVALKVLDAAPDDRDARRRFERELEITVRLGSHPHIVQVLDAGQATDGRPYLAMELFERGSAGDWLARHGTFTPADAIRAGAAIADALAAAHRAGVLHRDVKPENILLSEYGPALSDFGIARPADQLDRTSSFSQFTPWHAAPEVLLDHPPTETADVYSLASTLFTLLDGRPPFAGPPGETLLAFQRRVLSEPPRPLPSTVDPELADVLEAALARHPDQRIATAADFRDQLRALGAMGYPAANPPATDGTPGAVRTDRDAVGFAPRAAQPIDEVPELGATALRGRPAPPAPTEGPPLPPPPGPGSPPSGTNDEGRPARGPLGDRGDLTLTRAAGTRPDPVEVASDALVARSRWPFVAGGIALLLVVAVMGWMVVSGGDDKQAAPKRTTSTVVTIPDAPKGQSGKPKDLKIDKDASTSAQLSWTDTTDGGGTPIVLVVPEGGKPTPVEAQQGIGSFLVEDLDPDLGYCFVVRMLVQAKGSTGYVKIDSEPACIRGATLEGGVDASTTSAGPTTTTTTAPATTTTAGA